MKSIKNLKNFKGKTVLLRADFNAPIKDDVVMDDFRIVKTLPTIKYLVDGGAKVIIVSHLGDENESMITVADKLAEYTPVKFVGKVVGFEVSVAIKEMDDGDVILLENLRSNKGEVDNEKDFAVALASLAEIYVNDAFAVCHREHASVVGVPKLLPSYAGFGLLEEISNLELVNKPSHPFLFILGGAKFSTKFPLIKNFLNKADAVFVGGALANSLLNAEDISVGKSTHEASTAEMKFVISRKNLALPSDAVVKKNKLIKNIKEIGKSDVICDIGPHTIEVLEKVIANSNFIVFNGPVGLYEDGFSFGTEQILKAMAKSKAKTILGGGDTVDLVTKLGLRDSFTFVSTGGGAMIDYLAYGTLPGIEALG